MTLGYCSDLHILFFISFVNETFHSVQITQVQSVSDVKSFIASTPGRTGKKIRHLKINKKTATVKWKHYHEQFS